MSNKWITWVLVAILAAIVVVALAVGRPGNSATNGQGTPTGAGANAPATALPTVYEFTSDT